MWGRQIYENVRKFIQFQITMNISLLTIVFLSAISIGQPPFGVIQLLWMNLIMDVLAAIAICTEPFVEATSTGQAKRREEAKKDDAGKDDDFKKDSESALNKRVSRKERIFKPVMWRNIMPCALYQILVISVLMFTGQYMFFDEPFNIVTSDLRHGDGTATDRLTMYTIIFHTFMLMNIINMINCRIVDPTEMNQFRTLLNNKYFWLIFIFEMTVQHAMIYYADSLVISGILGTAPLTHV